MLYLDKRGTVRIDDVARELWRRLEETFDDNLEVNLTYQAMRLCDNVGDGPATVNDKQGDLLVDPNVPF